MDSTPSLENRLLRAERMLAALSQELAAIRGELGVDADSATPPPRGLATKPRVARPVVDLDAQQIERFLGRYGMLLIAVLAAAAAVGSFMSWAITHGYIHFTPAMRVAAGLVFAAAIGTWGLKLRRRERSFGSSMVGLALVLVHICAYAVGPGLHLLPTVVAFAFAALVSWALALFAIQERDEPLWCLGLAGAAVAPFVTSRGQGSVYALLAYGAIVTFPAALAIRDREWRVGWWVFYAVAFLYTTAAASVGADQGDAGVVLTLAFPLAIAAGAVLPFAPDPRKRGALRWLVAVAVLAALIYKWELRDPRLTVSIAVSVAALVSIALFDRVAELPASSGVPAGRRHPHVMDWVDAAVLPILLFRLFAGVLPRAWGTAADVCMLAALAWFSARRPIGPLRDAAACAAVAVGLWLIALLPLEAPGGNVIASVMLGVVSLYAHIRLPSRGWLAGGCAVLAAAAAQAAVALFAREAYAFTPFATEASLTAAVVVVGLAIVARYRRELAQAAATSLGDAPRADRVKSVRLLGRALWLAPWVWGFVWVMIELAMAYSASTSTLLLVVYFAATAVASVAAGRVRRSPPLRRTGLALALLAAGTAIYGATTYFDVGARIAAYLVTSGFLLDIAYWYRSSAAVVVAD
jgi:hypothetical protein